MTDHGRRDEGFTELEDRYAGYTVYDKEYEKVGKVDDLFVDEKDLPEYIGVRTGLLGTRASLIPFSLVRVNDRRRLIEVAAGKGHIEAGPSFDGEQEITPEFEREVHAHYGIERARAAAEPVGYGDYYRDTAGHALPAARGEHPGSVGTGPEPAGTVGGGMSVGATQGRGDDMEDELRVQRSEEELRAGVRQREAGALRVRKRVRVDREVIEVPKRREEVVVERIPVSGEAAETRIGEDEVVVPVTEEEVVVEKRPVVKEEVRIRKDVVEDTEIVEEDVRREEVDIEDNTDRRSV